MPNPIKTVPCPRCATPARFDASNKWRPFCSERCRMIDLGTWASEGYRVPAQDQEPDDLPPDEPH